MFGLMDARNSHSSWAKT